MQAARAGGLAGAGHRSWGWAWRGARKDRRGGTPGVLGPGRDAFLEYAPDVRLALRVRGGATASCTARTPANFGGPELGFLGRYRLNRRHMRCRVFGD